MTTIRPPIYIKALDEWLQNFCTQRGYTYLNYFKDMVDEQGQMGVDLADDGLQPNAKGYRIMAPLALAAIEKTLGTHIIISTAPSNQKEALAPTARDSRGGELARAGLRPSLFLARTTYQL